MFSFGETVTRIRPVPVLDPYSGEVTGSTWTNAPEFSIIGVAVEPRPTSEPVQDARNATVSAFTLYLPPASDITPADRVRVRGVVYDVDGDTANWVNPFTGSNPGMAVQTKRVSG